MRLRMRGALVRRVMVATSTAVAGVLGAAAFAHADSSTVSGEPAVVPGHQEFGNSSGDANRFAIAISYWGLRVIAGDRVSIVFQGGAAMGSQLTLHAEPVGSATQPGTVALAANAVASGFSNNRGFGRLRFSAPRTGEMPLAFTVGYVDAGPYTFTASVLHAVDLSLPTSRSVAMSGRVRVQAHDPDGKRLTVSRLRITLQYKVARNRWRAIGVASPRHGIASIRYRLPASQRGREVYLRARATGGGYFTVTSAAQRARVA